MSRLAQLVRATARRLRPEQGAMMVLASIVTVASMAAAALAVDIGGGVALKRDLQADADLAALDASRALGNLKGEGGLSPQVHAEQLAEEALERNGFDTEAEGNGWSVVLGVVDPVTRAFTTTDPSVATAVKVTVTSPIDWVFRPGGRSFTADGVAQAGDPPGQCQGDCSTTTTTPTTVPSSTTTTTRPTTQWDPLAGIAVGSFLARVSTSGGLLKDVFGKFLNGNVTLVGYTGIAAGSVNLGGLKTELGFGTVDELLTTQVTARNFLLAMVTVLQNKGDSASVQAATDLANLALATDSNLNVHLGDLIKVAQGAEGAAATAELNALQLAMMVAQVANGQNAVDINLTTQNTGSGLGSLLSFTGGNTLRLKVIEPPQIAFGPPGKNAAGQWLTVAKTAQVRAQIHLRPLGNPLGLGLLDLPIYVEAASATAALRSITCDSPLDDSEVVVHTDTQAVKGYVGNVANINASGTVTVNNATLLDLLLTDVRGAAQVNIASTNGDLTFDGPFNWSNTKTVGYGVTVGNLLRAQPVNVTLAGLNVGGLISAVVGIINPVLTAADDGLINNLLGSLGVSLGGGDVTNWALDCTDPQLVG
ncbi:MAG: hypothetical protein ACRDPR_19995 [Nocardioidaceae bacterium]